MSVHAEWERWEGWGRWGEWWQAGGVLVWERWFDAERAARREHGPGE